MSILIIPVIQNVNETEQMQTNDDIVIDSHIQQIDTQGVKSQ